VENDVVVRRAQWELNEAILLKKTMSKLGWSIILIQFPHECLL
jgi:hypothetical protein